MSAPTPDPRLPPAVRLAMEAAARLGMTVEVLDPDFGYLFEVSSGEQRRLFLGGRSPLNDAVAARLADDKHYTTLLLARAGLRVPRTARCLSRRDALDAFRDRAGSEPGFALADEVGYPVVVKPNRLSAGRGVRLVGDRRELGGAIRQAWELDAIALVQECVAGRDLRLDFLHGEYLAGYERRVLEVRGDGKRTVEELLAVVDPRMADPVGRRRILGAPGLNDVLEQRGWTPRTVLPEGATLASAGPIRNLNLGSTARIIERVPPPLREVCLAAGAALGLAHFGVDLKVEGETAVIIEVNGSPLLSQIYLSGHRELALQAQVKLLQAAFA